MSRDTRRGFWFMAISNLKYTTVPVVQCLLNCKGGEHIIRSLLLVLTQIYLGRAGPEYSQCSRKNHMVPCKIPVKIELKSCCSGGAWLSRSFLHLQGRFVAADCTMALKGRVSFLLIFHFQNKFLIEFHISPWRGRETEIVTQCDLAAFFLYGFEC